jgi:adenylate kinase family enzyme
VLSGRRRILVIGSGGSGKSTFAHELAQRTGIPLIQLDLFYWGPDWTAMEEEPWALCVEALARGETWIMDGNYGRSLETRLARCDAVVFFDLPRWICIAGVVRRWWTYRHRSRPDRPRGCAERLSPGFVRWVWSYPRQARPRIAQALAGAGPGVQIAVVSSRRAARALLDGVKVASAERAGKRS